MYWVVEIPSGALIASPDGRTTTLHMRDVPIVDQPQWPSYDTPTYPARLTFTLAFTKSDEPLAYESAERQFRFTGFKASAQLEAAVEVPSIGFAWRSDPLGTSQAAFAAIGEEINGRYYQRG
ncbi:MAG TPA: hypothetical protein VME66_03330 [Candidatus Acidoferrales bacterium]|nr:hypothetical protein [Candidatus Acidoferrales bacterium]